MKGSHPRFRTAHGRRLCFAAVLALYSTGALAAQKAEALIAQTLDVQVHPNVGVRRVVLYAHADGIVSTLEIRRPGERDALQRLPASTDEPPPDGSTPHVLVEDLDGDGHADLKLLSWWGVTGNAGYLAWRYDPRADRYVEIPDFPKLSQPRVGPGARCIHTRSNGGHAGAIHVLERWCWREGRLEIEWRQEQTSGPDGNYRRVTHERRNGTMTETARRALTPEDLERERIAEEGLREAPSRPAR